MRPWIGQTAVVSVLAGMSFAHAFTVTRSPQGQEVRWSGTPHVRLVGNSISQYGFSERALYSAVVRGLQRWVGASGGSVDFDYWQGRDTGKYLRNSEFNGQSSIYFSGAGLSSNVLGMTQVWYDTKTGEILEADIVLNERDFTFTADPRDTSGFGGAVSGRKVFIENVITHELGHVYGLTHTGHLQSTMLHMESPEQAHLSCDDQVGIRHMYGQKGESTGTLTGTVFSEQGQALAGAHVMAISGRRGVVMASSLADSSGRYTLSALEAGPYYVLAEPFRPGKSVLPKFYQQIPQTSFCRSFLTEGGGAALGPLLPVWVGASAQTESPQLEAYCGNAGGSVEGLDLTAEGGAISQGLVDQADSSGSHLYRLRVPAGGVRISALSYTLYSPLQVRLTLLDRNGNTISGRQSAPVFTGDSGYVNYDSHLEVDSLAAGDYWIRAEFRNLSSTIFPGGPWMVDSSASFVLSAASSSLAAVAASEYTDHPRCEAKEQFAPYVSPLGDPPLGNGNSQSTGFCGTIRKEGSGQGPRAGELIGWLLPWGVMLGAARKLKVAHRLIRLRQAKGLP